MPATTQTTKARPAHDRASIPLGPEGIWTPELTARLIQLWTEEGASAGRIADEFTATLGRPVGRSLVSGKIARMKLTGKGSRQKGSGRPQGLGHGKRAGGETVASKPRSEPERAQAPAAAVTPAAKPGALHPPGRWPLVDMRPLGQCKFACTEEGGRHLFCGEPAPIGPGNPHGSWCPAHRSEVFTERVSLGRPAYLKRASVIR